MNAKPVHVLFLCTANACRSQMAEAMLRHLDGRRFRADSAGASPAGFVHPLCLAALAQLEIPVVNPRSKSWDEFADVPLDVVITLCDHAAGQSCPVWLGAPVTAHWSISDPVFHFGTEDARLKNAVAVARQLQRRIEGLIALDFERTPPEILKDRIAGLARL